ncbi:hypothetical protein Leryth_013415 [Lithospermum erythrorhizon]|nr:hypothetical protein Leryth_013415 [Lithospermum erythrorhizon]
MAESIAITVVGSACRSFIDQTIHRCGYLWNLDRNIENLRTEVNSLENKRDYVKSLVDVAKRNAETVRPDVLGWLERVDNIKKDVEGVLEGVEKTRSCCFSYWKCPNFLARYTLSKTANSLTLEVSKLHEKGEYNQVGGPLAPPGHMPFSSTIEFEGFESRTSMRKDIVEALKDDSAIVIGVCGMGGVGKTTLVKVVADKVKTEKLFDEVVMAVVSQNQIIINIQDQLAEDLALTIVEKNNIRVRAERLYTRLMDESRKTLVILDDLWEGLDFHKIGIPAQGERKGLKVLLTSRLKQVCENIGAQKIIEVQVLNQDEAWYLFKKTAGISNDAQDNLKGLAKKVAQECQGLPLAIVIVGKALRGKEESSWEDAITQLKHANVTDIAGVHKEVYSKIRWSYDHLESQGSKLLLLLCSLFPEEDYELPLEDLVRYATGLQLYKGEPVHMVSKVGLKGWPRIDTYVTCTALSLDFDKLDELPSNVKCPNLQLLRLSMKRHKLKISSDFLLIMENLRVLDIQKICVEFGPSSISLLMNLRTLTLHNCELHGDLSLIANLRNLEILSFYMSSCLGNFPQEIGELIDLKCLDLRFEKVPSSFPISILFHLKKLEELYLGYVLSKYKVQEDIHESMLDFSTISNLTSIQFCIDDKYCLAEVLENLDVDRLVRFDMVSSGYPSPQTYQFRKRLHISEVDVDMLLKPTMKSLVSRTDEYLWLESIRGRLPDIIQTLSEKLSCFSRLKKLEMRDCDIKFLIDAINPVKLNSGVFIELEKLKIIDATELSAVCHGDLPPGSFARLRKVKLVNVPTLSRLWGAIQSPSLINLRKLEISGSNEMRNLISQSSVKCLAQLQELRIISCPVLETIISPDGQAGKYLVQDDFIEFPKLQVLRLSDLPALSTYGPELESYQVKSRSAGLLMPHLFSCFLPELRDLYIGYCNSFISVVDIKSIHRLQNVQHIEAWNCESLEVIFDFEGLPKKIIAGEDGENPLNQLNSLHVRTLPKLRKIWKMVPEGTLVFQKLTSLQVTNCESLKYLLTPSMANILVSLKELEVAFCDQMETIIGREEKGIHEIRKTGKGVEERNKLVLPNLTDICTYRLPEFRMLCNQSIELVLPLWNRFQFQNCPMMSKYSAGTLTAPELKKVGYSFYTTTDTDFLFVDLDVMNIWLEDCESGRRCLDCSLTNKETCFHLNEQASTSNG